ncbi:MAG: methyltransferase domain-containing protein [Betaproteobacteria bacterium]|nr:methyltransferase domain-containing protein [Betaproteobacteria bacterium]
METPDTAAPQSFRLDHALLRRRLRQAAVRVGETDSDFLAREIARRMDERLDLIRIAPRRILDLGCGAGHDLARLGERYPDVMRIGLDLVAPFHARARLTPNGSPNPLRRLFGKSLPAVGLAAAEAARLPLLEGSVSLVWANLMLPFIDDPLPVFREMCRVIETGGLVMFSTLGPDTLRELREILPSHAGERVHRFIDMHDLGDALIAAGFSDPVMDMEMATLTYGSLDELFADLRANAANNAALARPRGLSGRTAWEQARARYEQCRREERLPVTIEIIQGHAWKTGSAEKQPQSGARPDGRAVVHFHPRG